MNYDEVKAYLKSYKDLHYRLIWLNGKLEGVGSISYDDSVGIIGTPKTKVDYIQEKEDNIKKMNDIKSMIYSLDDYKQRYVLEYKYLCFFNLEQVAEIMHYSLPQIKRLHHDAIERLTKDDTF